MLIRFSTHTGYVDYLENNAVSLLKLMGQSGHIPGAIKQEDVAVRLQQLLQALAAVQPDPAQEADDGEAPISVHTRARPLIELLERATENREYVMWEARK